LPATGNEVLANGKWFAPEQLDDLPALDRVGDLPDRCGITMPLSIMICE
jgi:hypothetical protein